MIFSKFETSDIVTGRTQPVSTGLFAGGTSSWSSFHTSSAQATKSSSIYEPLNGLYYLNVYDRETGSIDSEICFSVTYGNVNGSGSSAFDTGSQGSMLYPTKAIYNQYRNLLLTPGDTRFTFVQSNTASFVNTEVNADEIYVISFAGSKIKDQLDPGQFEITIKGDSSDTITFIDDSRYNANPVSTQGGGKMYNLIQGTIAGGSAYTSYFYEGIGAVYPSLGIAVFNATALQRLIGNVTFAGVARSWTFTASQWSSQFASLPGVFFTAIKNGAVQSSMKARATEYVPSRHFFVRVKNQEYNYSNNPTFVLSSTEASNPQDAGKIRFSEFYTDPKVYITTVGLYNENNDLVAVAKLSQPLLKDFTNECLIKVKIDT